MIEAQLLPKELGPLAGNHHRHHPRIASLSRAPNKVNGTTVGPRRHPKTAAN